MVTGAVASCPSPRASSPSTTPPRPLVPPPALTALLGAGAGVVPSSQRRYRCTIRLATASPKGVPFGRRGPAEAGAAPGPNGSSSESIARLKPGIPNERVSETRRLVPPAKRLVCAAAPARSMRAASPGEGSRATERCWMGGGGDGASPAAAGAAGGPVSHVVNSLHFFGLVGWEKTYRL